MITANPATPAAMAPKQAAVGLAAIFPVPKTKPPADVPVIVHILGCRLPQATLDKLLPVYVLCQ